MAGLAATSDHWKPEIAGLLGTLKIADSATAIMTSWPSLGTRNCRLCFGGDILSLDNRYCRFARCLKNCRFGGGDCDRNGDIQSLGDQNVYLIQVHISLNTFHLNELARNCRLVLG